MNNLLVSISLTNSCNYNCSYCIAKQYNKHVKQSSKFGYTEINGCILDLDILVGYLDRYVEGGSTILLTGGEPMTAPYIPTLLTILSIKYKVIIETNGSQLFKLPNINYSDIRLLVAYHPKMILFDKFINNVKSCIAPKESIKLINIEDAGYPLNQHKDKLPYDIIDNQRQMDVGAVFNYNGFFFIAPNGVVQKCPKDNANKIGNIYDGSLDLNACRGFPCVLEDYAFCNTPKNAYLAFRVNKE